VLAGAWRAAHWVFPPKQPHLFQDLLAWEDGTVAMRWTVPAQPHSQDVLHTGEFDPEFGLMGLRRIWPLIGGPFQYHDTLWPMRAHEGYVNQGDFIIYAKGAPLTTMSVFGYAMRQQPEFVKLYNEFGWHGNVRFGKQADGGGWPGGGNSSGVHLPGQLRIVRQPVVGIPVVAEVGRMEQFERAPEEVWPFPALAKSGRVRPRPRVPVTQALHVSVVLEFQDRRRPRERIGEEHQAAARGLSGSVFFSLHFAISAMKMSSWPSRFTSSSWRL